MLIKYNLILMVNCMQTVFAVKVGGVLVTNLFNHVVKCLQMK